MTRERDRLQASNDHLAAEVDLTSAEIQDLQNEYADVERDLEDSEEQRRILEASLDRVQAALRRAETERPLVQDQVAQLQSSNPLAQERDRALASAAEAMARVFQIRSELESRQQGHANTVSELSRHRAVHNATLVDLDREIAAVEVARITLSDLQGSLPSTEETRGTARRQSMVAIIVGAPPLTRPEEEDPAALLRLLREDPADTSEHPTPRYLTYEDPLEIPPKDMDPHNLPDPVNSTAPKRPREDSAAPDPNSTPPAKRRPASGARLTVIHGWGLSKSSGYDDNVDRHLFPNLPTQPGWVLPHLDPQQCPHYRSTNYCSDLITAGNVRALLDTHPWEILEGTDSMISFEADVGADSGSWFRPIATSNTAGLP
ncbi:unnamed protein product [Phytophthora fragariaefolia]|uniref:Unnamed protein product n=1 Tax=Phytophthora fragariaefolia TaxID=1490495 RepID=A0A9W6Y1C9_9STRA|nr:unnamed protein product [Phytophthora fragariaefolia]